MALPSTQTVAWIDNPGPTGSLRIRPNTAVHQPADAAAPSLIRLARTPALRHAICTATPTFVRVTGALSRAMEGLVQALLGRAPHGAWAQQAACWAAMASGALLGAVLQGAWGDAALAVPATAALLGALVLGERTVAAAAA